MDSEISSASSIFQQKTQMINLMDEMIDQKKLLFQQLMSGINSLRAEIDQLENKRKLITAESTEKSLKDSLY